MGARDLSLFEQNNRIDKLQQSLREYVDLIEVVNEKISLQSEQMQETKNQLVKKMTNIEKNVIEKLD